MIGRTEFDRDNGIDLERYKYALESVELRVGKRSTEAITVRAAQDFDAFYADRKIAANDTLLPSALLVLSSDSKGITMRPESLRDAMRKEAEAASVVAVRGDPMAEKKLRKHDKRMAIVTAVWEQEPRARTADDIVENLQGRRGSAPPHKKTAAPKLHNKRIWASVEKSQATGIAEMFDEADRRDPNQSRPTVVLVDGEERQIEAIQAQALARDRPITIVLDVIHVLHYLWLAAIALCDKDPARSEAWVAKYLLKLLTRPALDVVAGIRQPATIRGLTEEQRRPVEKCAEYLLKNAHHIRYSEFLARGFPIATGVIEGACRHLIQDRLGITGARWNIAGAEAVLRLRALRSSGDWVSYWTYHLGRESTRNYAEAA